MVAHVIARLRPQVHRIVIIANDDPTRFAGTCLPVVCDTVEGRAGPLAGLHAALEWSISETPDARFVATVPVDTPFLPVDAVVQLKAALDEKGAASAIAACAGTYHPVVGLWDVALIGEVEDALRSGVRAMTRFAEMQKSAVVAFPATEVGGTTIDVGELGQQPAVPGVHPSYGRRLVMGKLPIVGEVGAVSMRQIQHTAACDQDKDESPGGQDREYSQYLTQGQPLAGYMADSRDLRGSMPSGSRQPGHEGAKPK
jgi:molybdopterin-guanine dinucleotide biosynthesis protein A